MSYQKKASGMRRAVIRQEGLLHRSSPPCKHTSTSLRYNRYLYPRVCLILIMCVCWMWSQFKLWGQRLLRSAQCVRVYDFLLISCLWCCITAQIKHFCVFSPCESQPFFKLNTTPQYICLWSTGQQLQVKAAEFRVTTQTPPEPREWSDDKSLRKRQQRWRLFHPTFLLHVTDTAALNLALSLVYFYNHYLPFTCNHYLSFISHR